MTKQIKIKFLKDHIEKNYPVSGWGKIIKKQEFLRRVKNGF